MRKNKLQIWEKNISKYDYIFCGMGASTSLLILELFRNGLLTSKKVLLIDKEEKNRKDKTFCFWSYADEPISLHLKDLITKSWDKLELCTQEPINLSPLSYHHIDSSDLYHKIEELIKIHRWDILIHPITHISRNDEGIFVELNDIKVRGDRVFDSRTPSYEALKTGTPHILQSFVGWMIETDGDIIDPEVFRFMDFDIEQQGCTQFVYVLPFSPTRALVEVTRFGELAIETREAEIILKKYIQKSYGAFRRIDIEIGCIPMTQRRIQNESIQGVINIGARNYNIKASTGYAFKNMYRQAFDIALALKKSETMDIPSREYRAILQSRFTWYDSLLLDILKNTPEYGKSIFMTLLQKIDIQKTLKFLDEKTNIREEISIFYQLPWKPFLWVLSKKIMSSPWFRPSVLILITLFFILLGQYTSFQTEIGFILFALGMITVGIPHGAVDHLLGAGLWNQRKAPIFILRYLLLALMMGILWLWIPQIALIVFLLYSMWHFGEADGKSWDFDCMTSLLWGISVLVYILGTHFDETNTILTSIGSLPLLFAIPVWFLTPWLLWAIYRKQFSLFLTIIFLILSSQIPLLFAFGIYFIGQHSLTGWKHLKIYLHTESKDIWLQSLPFHVGAWIIWGLFYFFWPLTNYSDAYSQWGLFFIFIACLSFPHVITMHRMYRRIKI